MTTDFARQNVKKLFDTISPFRDAYGQGESFSYFAIRDGTEWNLVRGIIFLNVRKSTIPFAMFNSSNIRAGHFLLRDVKRKADEFVEDLLSGKIPTPHGEIRFPSNSDNGMFGTHLDEIRTLDQQAQNRHAFLSIFGRDVGSTVNRAAIDWELRSSETPYDGLLDLFGDFQLGAISTRATVDIIAFNVAMIDAGSTIGGDTAVIKVLKSDAADQNNISLGYRLIEKGKTIYRTRLDNHSLNWTDEGNGPVGIAKIQVPRGVILHAFANYNDVAQHHYYVGDPNYFQNPRRTIYETFDPRLELMMSALNKSRRVRAPSRDFEAYVTWLFWILGFSTMHLGAVLTEAPDALLATANGSIAIVECTTNFLDGNKLGKLHSRVQSVRNALNANSQHSRLLPVIVSALGRDEVQAGIDQAAALGIYVITREGLDQLIDRTLLLPNADQMFDEAERSIVEIQSGLRQS